MYGSEKSNFRLYILYIIATLIITAVTVYLDVIIYNHQKNEVKNSFDVLANITKKSLLNLRENHLFVVNYWSKNKKISHLTEKFILENNDFKKKEKIIKKIQKILSRAIQNFNLKEFKIINAKGINIISNNALDTGKHSEIKLDSLNWKRLISGQSIITRPVNSLTPPHSTSSNINKLNPTLFAAAPIHSEKLRNSYFLTFRLSPKKLFWEVLEQARLGKTGESYIINNKGLMLSPSRFRDNLIKNGIIDPINTEVMSFYVHDKKNKLTAMAKSIQKMKPGYNLTGYSDYRGVQVVGVWTWIPEYGVGLTVEQDHNEAYSYYNYVKTILWSFYVIVLLLTLVLFTNTRSRIIFLSDDLKEKEDTLTSIFHNTKGVIYRCLPNNNWTMTYLNKEVEHITGYKVSDFIGDNQRSFASIIHHEDRVKVKNTVFSALDEKRHYEIEYRLYTKTGKIKSVLERGQGIYDPSGICLKLDGFILDITEQKNLENALENSRAMASQLNKMASMGEMAGGIAHEINNPLAIIKSICSVLERRLISTHLSQQEALTYIQKIIKNTNRISTTIGGIHKFTKNNELINLKKHDLYSFLHESLSFTKRSLDLNHLKINVCIPSKNVIIEFDENQLTQVVVSLVSNASEILISKNIHSPTLDIYTEERGDQLALLFHDNGPGIPEKLKTKIFEPFFTTKPIGQGLGLSICYKICKNNSIELKAEKSQNGAKIALIFKKYTVKS